MRYRIDFYKSILKETGFAHFYNYLSKCPKRIVFIDFISEMFPVDPAMLTAIESSSRAQKKTAIPMIIGLIARPIVGVLLNDYIAVMPARLTRLLEYGDVEGFNDLRAQFKQQISFERIDYSNKNLSGVNLDSVILIHSNLFNTKLED